MKVVVIGTGVNERVAANYLALGGHEVTLIRERVEPDDDTFEPGWMPPRIARDLDLERYGLKVREPDPWLVVPPEDTGLELTRDINHSAEQIRRLSSRDADRWPEFCARMHALSRLLETLYTSPPPDPLAKSVKGIMHLAGTALHVRELGRQGMEDFLRLLPMPVADWLDEWFESDLLKGALGAGGVMHLAQGPRSGGTAFNMLHHCVGSPRGVFRAPLTNARAALAKRTDAAVKDGVVEHIDVSKGRVVSVVLQSAEELAVDAVVSGEPPARTLLELIDPALLDPELIRAVRNIRGRGAVARVSVVIDREPRFSTLAIAPSLDYLERAYDDFKYGAISESPYIEARYMGETGPKRHTVELHVQYVPNRHPDGVWDTTRAEHLARLAVDRVTEHVPGARDWIIGQTVATPADLENIRGFPQAQEYHAELSLDQILWMRPVPELSQYRTPISGLYLCGPSMHPGGGIAGAAGANAASVVIRDLSKG